MVFGPFAFESFRGEVAKRFRRADLYRSAAAEASLHRAGSKSSTSAGKMESPARESSMANLFFAVVHEHADSVLALRIVFSICLAIVFLAGLYILRIRKRLFDRDPEVTGDHYGARNLRLWQVILVWILAMDLLIMVLWRL